MPAIATVANAIGAKRALDLFTGTTRVAQGLKADGALVTAVDSATYSHVIARTYIAADAAAVDMAALDDAIAALSLLPGRRGYVTEVFCEQSRYFHPDNGARIDAIRDAIEEHYASSPLYPILLTSLLEAADRVDSTTGLQMAYLKQWAPRALRPLALRVPNLLAGAGVAIKGDAVELAVSGQLGPYDLAYIDPPYNQHRYFTNYHVWETLVRWDAPAHYGIACKRIDCREEESHSPFNRRASMASALAAVVAAVDATVVVLSYNDEAWLGIDDLIEMSSVRGHVEVLRFDSKRYVGAQIGIHDLRGVKVGAVSHLRNTEIMLVCGPGDLVATAVASVTGMVSQLDS